MKAAKKYYLTLQAPLLDSYAWKRYFSFSCPHLPKKIGSTRLTASPSHVTQRDDSTLLQKGPTIIHKKGMHLSSKKNKCKDLLWNTCTVQHSAYGTGSLQWIFIIKLQPMQLIGCLQKSRNPCWHRIADGILCGKHPQALQRSQPSMCITCRVSYICVLIVLWFVVASPISQPNYESCQPVTHCLNTRMSSENKAFDQLMIKCLVQGWEYPAVSSPILFHSLFYSLVYAFTGLHCYPVRAVLGLLAVFLLGGRARARVAIVLLDIVGH